VNAGVNLVNVGVNLANVGVYHPRPCIAHVYIVDMPNIVEGNTMTGGRAIHCTFAKRLASLSLASHLARGTLYICPTL